MSELMPEQPKWRPPEPDPNREPRPEGEAVAWSVLGTLLSGPIVWGGVGWLVDRWVGTAPLCTVIGVVIGSVTAFYIVYVRFGRD